MPPCVQGFILGLLTASLLLVIAIALLLASQHKTSTTQSITTQISTGKFSFSLNDLRRTDEFFIKFTCSHCLSYA
jgi:hypothetical protein